MHRKAFFVLSFLLVAIRFFHFGEEIDLPHDWRQCDTAYYILDFYINDIELFAPAVCWMGDYERIIFEFPLTEGIVALILKVTGESMFVMRVIFLLFFLGAVYYFYRLIGWLFSDELARIATLIYLSLPLSLFYSRAIHIDFSVLFWVHALVYYFVRGITEKRGLFILYSSFLTLPVVLMKIPYLFCFVFPFLWWIWKERRVQWTLPYLLLFLFPLLVFIFWQQYVYQINSEAPDWNFLPHYRKFTDNAHWYFGAFGQRLKLYSWKILSVRLIIEVCGGLGFLAALVGVFNLKKYINSGFVITWSIGLLVYLLLFFNLNFIHNYYQLPFVSLAALLIARGIVVVARKSKRFIYGVLAILVIVNISIAEYLYYDLPDQLIEAGKIIEAQTNSDDLVVITYQNFDCRNPKILYRSKRRGWSLETKGVSDQSLEKLKDESADYWVYIGQHPPDIPLAGKVQPAIFPLKTKEADKVFIFDLR